MCNIDDPTVSARSCYAGNGGDYKGRGMSSCNRAQQEDRSYRFDPGPVNGIFHVRSIIRIADVRDGTGSTFYVAEKYLNPDHYYTGRDGGDNQPMLQGYDVDTVRFTNSTWPPKQDRAGVDDINGFGSAHPGGFLAALCDGSVQTVSYSIHMDVYRLLGNRKDGEPIDASAF
jgi:hypothetical protein